MITTVDKYLKWQFIQMKSVKEAEEKSYIQKCLLLCMIKIFKYVNIVNIHTIN